MRQPLSDEARNLEIINNAYLLAAEQIEEGTVSAQVLSFFLKYGADYRKNKLEEEKMEAETALAKAKVEAIKEAKDNSVLLRNVLKAFSTYKGEEEPSDADIARLIDNAAEDLY